MNIGLTGSSGVVGGFLLDQLKNDGKKVFTITHKSEADDNLTDYYFDELARLEQEQIDCLIHCGAQKPNSRQQESMSTFMQSNLLRTISLAEWAVKRKISKFIYISSAHIEDYLSRNTGKKPSNIYSSNLRHYFMSKLLAEIYLQDLFRDSETTLSILQIGTPISEDFCGSILVENMIESCLSDKPIEVYVDREESINLTWLPDLFRLVMNLMSKDEFFRGEVLSSSHNIPFLVECLDRLFKKKLKVMYAEMPSPKRFKVRNLESEDSKSVARTEFETFLSIHIKNRIAAK